MTTTPEDITGKYKKGLVIVLTGNGKGKTTSALGQALRAAGHGFRIHMIQFMKGRKCGEACAAETHIPGFTIEVFGRDGFVMKDHPAPKDIELAERGLARAREVIASKAYEMIILDEINVAVNFNLISCDDVLGLIRNKPSELDLVLTGRYAHPHIIEGADTVSEVREIKHHYAKGVKERAGIEF